MYYIPLRADKSPAVSKVDKKYAKEKIDDTWQDAGLLLPEDVVVVDFDGDNPNERKYIDWLLENYHTMCVETTKGNHLYYKLPPNFTMKKGADKYTLCGLQVDYVLGNRAYVIVKKNGALRPCNQSFDLSNLPLLPIPLYPLLHVKSILAEKKEGDGRNQALFQHILLMKEQYPDLDKKPIVDLINNFIFDEPMSEDELKSIYSSAMNHNGKGKTPRKKKPIFRIETLKEYFEGKGVTLRYNIITKSIEYIGLNVVNGTTIKNFEVNARDELSLKYRRIDKNLFYDYLWGLATNQLYNPVLELLRSTEWDGKDRFQEVYEILNVEDEFSKKLIKKWFWQGISLLHNKFNDYIHPDGMLVLQGEQGLGKTMFFEKLAIKKEWFGEGRGLDSNDKDEMIRSLNVWICEFGELESTLRKAQIEDLKRFITKGKDVFRRPYGRGDEEIERLTNLCATCNSEGFLIDQTGNRRFWTVRIGEIDWKKLNKLDVVQLWAQAYQTTKNDLTQYRMNREEMKILEEMVNSNALKDIVGESEVRDIVEKLTGSGEYTLVPYTVTDWKNHFIELNRYSAEQVSRVLKKMGFKSERKKTSGKVSRIILLPQVSVGGGCTLVYSK